MQSPAIALIDDGELEDVREFLRERDADYVHWTRRTVPTHAPRPTRLLVVTAAFAASLGYRRTPGHDADRPVWIAITDSASRSQRSLILRSGFDYFVCRPVHPAALRLLLERALYKGQEQRERSRVAAGYEVSFRAGLRLRPATLIDLSPTGCRLLTRHRVNVGYRLNLQFPRALTGGKAFSHPGVVVRCGPGPLEGGDRGEFFMGIRFAKFAPESRELMRGVLNGLCTGPATLREGDETPSTLTQPTLPSLESLRAAAAAVKPKRVQTVRRPDPEPTPQASDRRERRSVYTTDVPIFGLGSCALKGRDLSRHGLRVEAHAALVPGAQIRLMLPCREEGDAVSVAATVMRDDGEAGIALKFDWIDDESRLGELVDDLPVISTLDDDDRTQPVIMSGLVPPLVRRKLS